MSASCTSLPSFVVCCVAISIGVTAAMSVASFEVLSLITPFLFTRRLPATGLVSRAPARMACSRSGVIGGLVCDVFAWFVRCSFWVFVRSASGLLSGDQSEASRYWIPR